MVYEPFVQCNFSAGDCPLAVYANIKRAKEAKKEILKTCGHKDVFIIGFWSKALKGEGGGQAEKGMSSAKSD